MKNLEEVLSLSKWLHENGCEADMVFGGCEPYYEYELSPNNDDSFFKEYTRVHGFEKFKPWVSLERCLEELPSIIEDYSLQLVDPWCDHKTKHKMLGYFKRQGLADVEPLAEDLYEMLHDSYHVSALRLLKRVKEMK